MPELDEYFAEEYFHVYNRGVEKRNIFMEEKDYLRFVEGLREFNTTEASHLREIRESRRRLSQGEALGASKASPWGVPRVNSPIVEILSWCLMPNHFHLILKPLAKGGLTSFMRKLATGYSMYFNKKYERTGTLLQGPFKSKEIDTQESLLYVSAYIHLNPVTAGICQKPEDYCWSSYHDFISEETTLMLKVIPDFTGISADNYRSYVVGLQESRTFYKEDSLLIDGE